MTGWRSDLQQAKVPTLSQRMREGWSTRPLELSCAEGSGSVAISTGLDAEALEHRLKSRALDAQAVRSAVRAGQHAIRFAENTDDVLPFHLGKTVVIDFVGNIKFSGRIGQSAASGHDYHALDHVFEFANIAGPGPVSQDIHGFV